MNKKITSIIIATLVLTLTITAISVFADMPNEIPDSTAAGTTDVAGDSNGDLEPSQPTEVSEAQTVADAQSAEPIEAEAASIETCAEAYHKSLNTIDYFDTASGHFTSSLNGDDYDIEYATDMVKRVAYQHFTDNKGNDTEEYFSDGSMMRYNNVTKYCYELAYNSVAKEDVAPLDDGDRLKNDGPYGALCCHYRADPTNITQSCVSLYPQGMAVGLLNDFDLWEIDGKIECAERSCAVIKGTAPNGSYKGISTFVIYIDEQTGVWLYADGVNGNGETVFSIETEYFNVNAEIQIDFDETSYADYVNAR